MDTVEEAVLDFLSDVRTYPFPGLWGWMSTGVVVSGYTIWAKKTQRATMSRTVWHYKDFKTHPRLAPVIVGGWLYLTYHLLLEDYIRHNKEG
jgi:hypothetical protein